MIDSYKIVPMLLIYTAILLLIIYYLYPLLKKLLKWKISISIRFKVEGKESEEIKETAQEPENQEKFPSVLGKSKFVLRQPLPNATTDLKTENREEKGDTFAPETKTNEDKRVNYETGEGVEVPEENEDVPDVDLNVEEEDLGAGNIPEEASGTDFNDLGRTAKTVSDPEGSNASDEQLAGKVLSENKYTGLVKSMQEARSEYAQRIKELIDRHEQKVAETENRKVEVSRKKQKFYESEEFKNFNIDEIS